MNIFVTDPSPIISAQALDDKRVNKMILESTQLLCNALRFHGCDESWLYRSTHVNHPCSVWVRTNEQNYLWLCEHTEELINQYWETRQKDHGCYRVWHRCLGHSGLIPEGERTPFVECITSYPDMTDHGDIHTNYKHYLVYKWNTDVRKPTWINREAASFVQETEEGYRMV